MVERAEVTLTGAKSITTGIMNLSNSSRANCSSTHGCSSEKHQGKPWPRPQQQEETPRCSPALYCSVWLPILALGKYVY